MIGAYLFYTIYQTKNKINGKIYIGKHKTDNLQDDYLGSGVYLRKAIEKYGSENFERTILHVYNNEDEMNTKERELVNEEFINRADTYNLNVGGYGGFHFINENKLNNNHKDKVAYINQRRKNGQETHKRYPEMRVSSGERFRQREKLGLTPHDGFLGKTHTDEWKSIKSAQMKLVAKGENNSQFGTRWITDGISSKKILKDEILPDGWRPGRVISR